MSENNTTAVIPATDEQIEARLKIELEKIKATIPEAKDFSVTFEFSTWYGAAIWAYAANPNPAAKGGSQGVALSLRGFDFDPAPNALRHRWDAEEARLKAEATS